MKWDIVKKCIELSKQEGLASFHYKENDFEITLGFPQGPLQEIRPVQEVPTSQEPLSSTNNVTSPIVGTFYQSSSPDAPPFISVGDTVKKGQILCIIEAMKVMNEIESPFDGVLKEILVKNEDAVDFGKPLFIVE